VIAEALENTKASLPLYVRSVDWEDPLLLISGDGWSLRCMCPWRISSKGIVLFGCWDHRAAEGILDVIGLALVNVGLQSPSVPVDPTFDFNNAWRLELFSTDSDEPWVFRPPNGPVLVGSPTDSAAFSR
jgi:hypothetical protein